MGNSTDKVKSYLQRNWFKISIAIILVFIALKKDLSFRINLNSPVRMEQVPQRPPTPARQQEKVPSQERYTENTRQEAAATELPGADRFDFSSTANGRREIRAIDRLEQVDEGTIRAYIGRFARVAAGEQKKFGIPASIILANALLHSLAGTAEMAAPGVNNHFAIPCTPDWRGPQRTFSGQCYRQYENAWTSFRDHSFYITTGPFAPLRQLPDTDYKGWAGALEKAGFSGEKNLARQLVGVIETYGLQEAGER
ncbi:MAG: glucosaminidase domain-containing protein [Phaeodactylibacter sp.]|nr:glucosaminidase domain-containing protein [Phaeodactylibacter sp.]MCB9294537.1 glucosaminidase domain-containing protein [Lewinellaceae bacterium]